MTSMCFNTWLTCIIITIISVAIESNRSALQTNQDVRHGKFFPLSNMYRFRNDPCYGTNHLNGTCYAAHECKRFDGLPAGSCASGRGVCCVLLKTCGSKTKVNCTYFTNPEYPLSNNGGSRCSITVKKCYDSICQLRLDFLDFTLAQPTANGDCRSDSLSVTGGASPVPRICGENTNQHIYVDFSGDDPIQISVDTSSAQSSARKWNIKITQIACDGTNRAPTGCLMFYTALSGKVMSFNYGIAANPTPNPTVEIPGTRQMSNLKYGICVKMAPGYCAIQWSQERDDRFSFTLSGPTDVEEDIAGTPAAALNGADCTQDFIVIPNPSQNGMALNTDRFCGNALIPTTTSSKPFVLTVVTDGDEGTQDPDRANRGFCLRYSQTACPTE